MKALATKQSSRLPIFNGKSFDEHVTQWQSVGGAIDQKLWKLAAIAASLVTRYGDGQVKSFSEKVAVSTQRIYEIAATYRKFENSERSEKLSFHHHTIAARSCEPALAIKLAETKGWSTRELEFYVSTGAEPAAPLALPKASEMSKQQRAQSRNERAAEIVQVARKLREISTAHPGFAEDINKVIYRIELQLARPAEKQRRVLRALQAGRMADGEELAEETGLDAVSLRETLDALIEAGLVETCGRNGAAVGGRGSGKSWRSTLNYRRASTRVVGGPSQAISARR